MISILRQEICLNDLLILNLIMVHSVGKRAAKNNGTGSKNLVFAFGPEHDQLWKDRVSLQLQVLDPKNIFSWKP
jgi:hypothetical protein